MKKTITLLIFISLSNFSFGQYPTNLVESNITLSAVEFSWDGAMCNGGYHLKYKAVNDINWTELTVNVSNPFLVSNLQSLTNYEWSVKCALMTQWSNSYFFTTLDSSNCNLNTSVTTENATCENYLDGDIFIQAHDGTPPYSYLWNNNDTSSSQIDVIPGIYTAITTDAIGCTKKDTILLDYDNLISLSQSISSFIDTNNPGFLNIVQGLNIFVFDTLRLFNYGCDINIRPEFIISHEDHAIQQGQIKMRWQNPFGGFSNIPYSINNNGDAVGFFNTDPLDSTGMIPYATNEILLLVKFKNQAPYGKYTAIWNTKEVDNLGNIIQTITANDTATLTLVDCNSLQSYSSQSNITCWSDSNGILSIDSIKNGSGNYTYNWTDDLNPTITLSTNNSISNLSSGNYSCNITDDNWGCLINKGFSVSEPNELISSYSQENVSCYNINDGGAIVNFFGGITGSSQGDTNYILGWAGTSQPVYLPYPQTVFNTSLLPSPYNAIPAGIYPYTVTDLNGCIIYDTISITEPDSLYANYILSNYNGYNVACFGDNNATIEIQINGGTAPFNNYLNNILKTGIISNNLSAGNYIDSIIDANGCAFSNLIPLNEPSELITTLNTTDISCNNLCDGVINSNTSGGTLPYYYLWTNAQTTANISSLCNGYYSLTVTDVNECVKNSSNSIIEPNAITLNIDSIFDITTYGDNDGLIYITANGGSGSLNTNWTSENSYTSTNNDILNLYSDSYYLEVIDSNLCSYLDTFELYQPSSLWLSIDSVVSPSCHDYCNGAINVTAQGGDSIYSYSWTGPSGFTSNNNSINNLCHGEYIIIIDDGITILIDTINIYQPQPITTLLSVDSIICHNSTTQAGILVWGGSQPFMYSWSNGGNSNITTVNYGNYSINVTDQNGCSIIQYFSLTNPDSIIGITSSTSINCFGGNNGSISINILNGGISPYNFSNDNGLNYQISNTFSNLLAGNYSFLISDINGCLGSAFAEVIEPPAITSTTTSVDASCFSYCDGSVTSTALGGSSPYSYSWANGASNLCAGFYNLVITDINGCVASNSAIVNEPNPLIINISIDGSNIIATSGFISYQWYDNNNNPINGATDSIFTPLEMGIYYVTVTDANSCSTNSYSIEYTISTIEDYSSIINIFPNPTNGNITVTSRYGIRTIELYNTIGNKLYSVNNKENNTTETKLDLSTFANGVYFITINTNNQIINQRIILQ